MCDDNEGAHFERNNYFACMYSCCCAYCCVYKYIKFAGEKWRVCSDCNEEKESFFCKSGIDIVHPDLFKKL